jgi:hypothetical protein
MDQNSIQERIKSILKSGKVCYHSVQNLLSSRFLSENTKVYRTILCVLPCMNAKLVADIKGGT